jgi:ribosomal protein L11 methylase PrmA
MKSMHIDFKNTDILDIGSGTGFYVGLWKELSVRSVVGTDITNIAVEY